MNEPSFQARTQKQVLDLLAEAGGKLTTEDDIVFEGRRFILPETMNTIQEAVDFLQDRADAEEEVNTYSRTFDYRPWDGAWATNNVLRKAFGAVLGQTVMTMFGPNPPELITIKIGPNETAQVPWGRLVLPGFKRTTLDLGMVYHSEKGQLFAISAQGPRKYRHHIEGFFRMVDKELRENSLYRGKAFDGQENPDFIDVSGVDPDKAIYGAETMLQLEANIWTTLRHIEEAERLGIPFKRAILLEGPYGTGKTLAAMLTSKVAVDNGITFIMCRPGKDDIHAAMQTAKLYEPAVVFFEDVDTISGAGVPGQDGISQLLDTFDGMSSKTSRVMAILTTNNVEKIHKGMVRPGRLDAILHIGHIDRAGIEKFIRITLPAHMLRDDLDFDAIHEAADGYLPAFIKEMILRAIRYSMAENDGKGLQLTTENFVAAANGLRPQFKLMNDAPEEMHPAAVDAAISNIVRAVSGHVVEGVVNSTKLVPNPNGRGHKLSVED